jgi:Ca-activated chloride channel family protein
VVRFESVAEREGDAVRVDYFRGQSTQAQRPQPQVRPASGIERPFVDPAGRTTFALTYRAGGELGEAYSPTHELDVDRNGALREVSIRGGGPDITVLVALRRSTAASVALLTHATRAEPGYALITVTPPTDLAANRTSRDVTFVIDVSGSMSGRKLEQAKAAGRQLLRTLTDRDRFRIIDFSTDVRSFRDDFVLASDANIRAGLRYLEDLEAVGSTNISGALEEALRGMRRAERHWDVEPSPEQGLRAERLPLVLFITDGAPTVGDRDPASIAARAARLRGDARIFSVGMGADVNVSLIEQLALEGRGTAHFVRPEESVERAVELLATRLRSPLLTDVRVVADGNVRLTRMYPSGPQDIFAGQDLVLLARYDGSGSANLVVTGNSGGRRVQWRSERNFGRDERDNAFVPRLWATQRIGWLSAEKRRSGGSSEIDQEIRMLGERFGIPTEFTSYLVLEPGMVAGNVRQDTTRLRRLGGGQNRLNEVVVTGARGRAESAPAAAAPVIQFEAARAAADQRSAKSVAAADAATLMDADMRRVGTRMFQRDGDRWVDTRMKPELRVYKVKAYSAAYFSLIEKLPDLKEAFALGDRVLVAGRTAAIEVVEDGADLSATEVETIVRNW